MEMRRAPSSRARRARRRRRSTVAARLRVFDAGGLVETPFQDGRGSFLLAGRYGYPGPVLGAITPTIKLGYWDYQGRATWRLTDRDTVGVFAFGSHDYLGTASVMNGQTGPIVEQLVSDFHRVDVRYDHPLTDGNLRLAATLGHESQGGAGTSENGAPVMITDPSAALRLELDGRLSPAFRLRAGATGHYDRYSFWQPPSTGNEVPVPASVDPPPTNLTAEAHADVVWHLGPRVELVPGLRAELFASSRSSSTEGIEARTSVAALDPRLSTRVTLTPSLAWLATAGIAHQFPALRVGPIPGLLLTVPGFPLGDNQLQRALQAAQGIEVSLPAALTATMNGFFSYWSGLTDLTANCLQIMPPTTAPPTSPPGDGGMPPAIPYTCPAEQPLHGYAYGMELLVRRPLSRRVTGWLSYTLSRSRRQENFITLTGGDALATVPSDYDRTHVLNAVLAVDLGRHWRAGGRALYYSGSPYSDLSGDVPVPPYNNHRGPPFFRLDVRLEKRWSLGKDRALAFVLEGLNVTLSKETSTIGLDCLGTMMPEGGTTQCSVRKIGPLTIPSVGVQAFF